jgi:hypothetical protein
MFSEFFQNESCRVQFEQFVNAWIQYALLPPTAIGRGCSTGANHAKNRRLTSSDLKTRVAIARSIGSADGISILSFRSAMIHIEQATTTNTMSRPKVSASMLLMLSGPPAFPAKVRSVRLKPNGGTRWGAV